MVVKVNLERWLPHLEAAKREGKTVNAYARSRGLAACTLYAARQMLSDAHGERTSKRKGPSQHSVSKAVSGTAFAAVKLAAPVVPLSRPSARLQARLPNGVMLELAGADAALLAVAIKTLARR
jgi:hypothetical protein